jgi:dihydroflavonol-4-reductase
MSELVTVTGAAGFIAAHVVRELLERGYRVRGTVRRLKQPAELAHLTGLPGAAERLTLVEADLMTPGAFDAAVQGATYVLHTASPYTLDVKDPARDLVDPARRGTENVLEAAARAGGVRRVVVTSSMAAITDEPGGDHVLTEADWNVKSSLTRNPYYHSKTVAERAAWTFMDERKPAFDLVVVNPFVVIGPSLSPGLRLGFRGRARRGAGPRSGGHHADGRRPLHLRRRYRVDARGRLDPARGRLRPLPPAHRPPRLRPG